MRLHALQSDIQINLGGLLVRTEKLKKCKSPRIDRITAALIRTEGNTNT
jgi:hypothetical protein